MLKKLCLVFLAVLAIGCQKTVVREVMANDPTTRMNNPDGGVDPDGGGTCLPEQQDCLENTAFNAFMHEGIQEHIKPLIRQLAKTNNKFAAAMMHILKRRTWYMVPVPLKKIDAVEQGIYFPGQQTAVQTRWEVWIDSKSFEKLNPKAQMTLLMHEIAMGVRLLRFTKANDRCQAIRAAPLLLNLKGDAGAEYNRELQRCDREYPPIGSNPVKEFAMGPEDYAKVRSLTVRMFSNDYISEAELDSWLIDAKLMEASESKFFNPNGTLNSLGESSLEVDTNVN